MRYRNRFNLPTRKIIPEDQTKELLKPHLDLLFICVKDAWATWEKLGVKSPEIRKPLDSTARANIIWNHIKQNVKNRFRDIPGVSVREKGRLFALDISGVALIRFKKLNSKFRSSNVPTKRQMELQMQIQTTDTTFTGFSDDATWLTCGYVLNALETEIEKYAVTCSVGSKMKYVIPIVAGNVVTPEIVPSERTVRKAKVLPQRKSVTKQAQAINE